MNRVIDFNEQKEKSLFIDGIRRLEGRWRVEWVRYRPRRSDRQNRYYWPCFVEPFADYMRVDPDSAHLILKAKFLRKEIIDKETGERFVFVLRSSKLSTSDFNEYLDDCAAFLAGLMIYVPEPNVYHELEQVMA
jgi:hypothetical protein